MKRIKRTTSLLITTLALGALTGCSAPAPIEGCAAVGEIQPYCQMQAPEDIAALDDGRYLLLAHFGGMDEGAGSISLFDTQTAQRTPLFPAATTTPPTQELWGDASCTTPPGEAFSPHGYAPAPTRRRSMALPGGESRQSRERSNCLNWITPVVTAHCAGAVVFSRHPKRL